MTVAFLALVLILGLNWLTFRASKRQMRRFNALEDQEGEPVTALLPDTWTQDYVLYARLD